MKSLISLDVYDITDKNSWENTKHMYKAMTLIPDGIYLQEYICADGTSVMEVTTLTGDWEKMDFLTDIANRMPLKEGIELYMDREHKNVDMVGYYGQHVTVCKLTFIK